MPASAWEVHLEAPLPDELHVGDGAALLVQGWCLHHGGAVRGLRVRAQGRSHPADAVAMPRLDVLVHQGQDGYATGFWAVVPLHAPYGGDAEEVVLVLEGEAAGGEALDRELHRLTVRAGGPPPWQPTDPPRVRRGAVAIAMATHDPDPELFARQVGSLRAQTHEDWHCVIADDGSRPDRFEALRAVLGDDPRFTVHRFARRAGFYANFGRALERVPAEAEVVALADQDDVWHPDKLAELAGALERTGAMLAFCDQRLVSRDGEVLERTFWRHRDEEHDDLGVLLTTNTVTGAASAFRRELLDVALPLPPRYGQAYHDHWLALLAAGMDRIAYVDRPLHDYVQHGGQVIGGGRSSRDRRGDPPPPGQRRRRGGHWRRVWEAEYFEHTLARRWLAVTLRARLGERVRPDQLPALEAAAAGDLGAGGLARHAVRAVRELPRRRLTLGYHGAELRGALWRRGVHARARLPLRPDDDGRDSVHWVEPLVGDAADLAPAPDGLERRIAPLVLDADPARPRRVNVLMPVTDTRRFPIGHDAVVQLALALAREGAAARLVSVDPGTPSDAWAVALREHPELEALEYHADVSHRTPLQVHPEDAFVASTWWTAHVAASAGRPFGWLVAADAALHEPRGAWAAAAEAAHRLDHVPLVAGPELREHLAGRGLLPAGAPELLYREPVPHLPDTAREPGRRLLLDARGGLDELALAALRRALAAGALEGWELFAWGGERGERVALGDDHEIVVLPGSVDLAGTVAACDLGLVPFDDPRPGDLPAAMAAAGMVVVTTTFGPKTAERLAALSPNLLGVAPSIEALTAALAQAPARRVPEARIDWPWTWQQAFPPATARALLEALEISH